ncbi:MAG TPA: IS110 family transposase, partial [Trebonia sp.]|nr:IS110 family transposase [Trebonia sp.]
WLAQLLECGLVKGSFIPPAEVKAVRGLVRYRAKTARQRVSEIARLGGTLQDAGIKTGPVASSVAAKSGTGMIEALIDGERRGAVLAGLAKGRMRSKIPDLPVALEGRLGEHHALMCRLHLDHIAYLEKTIAELEAMIEAKMQPFLPARDLLMTIPGIARLSAAAVISETGPGPRQCFPSAGHLASWAGLCPGSHESAGKRYSGRRRHGNVHLQSVMIEIAWAAVRHDGYLKSPCHRHVVRNGGYRSKAAKNKAIFTVAHAIIEIIWHMLSTGTPYQDLGAGYYDRPADPDREARRLIARLEALGKHVTLEEAA